MAFAAPLILFLLSTTLLALVLTQWSRTVAPSEPLRRSSREGEWSQVCILLLRRASEDVLGQSLGFGRTLGRTTLVAACLLGTVWPVAGWLSGKPLGFSGAPWQLFDQTMALLQRISATQASQAQIHGWVSYARSGPWKYLYAGCATMWIACWSAAAFWCAAGVARYLLHELESAATWAQKAGLMLGLAAFTLMLLNVLTFLVGFVVAPASWLAVAFAGTGLSWWADIALAAAANALTFYLSDPWLKGLILVCLFPCLLPLVSAGIALALDIWRLGIRVSREKLLDAAQRRFGRAYVPLLMTATALYAAYWILSRLL